MDTTSASGPRPGSCRSLRQPGFRSYAVAIGEGKVFSSSAWDSRGEAESGSAAVATWVAENMTEITLDDDIHDGDVAFSTSSQDLDVRLAAS
jgi:hypothetical protein